MVNNLIFLFGKQDCPGTILGIVVGMDPLKPACKVKFHNDCNFDECVVWIRKAFCECTKLHDHQLTVTRNEAAREVQIKG